ncbi:MAG TPA: thioredoxin family protein [Acidobacteriaceae bacterium]|jgi:thiol:disulfide interchange protein|nr:thioredoxin family protein [Acidobacteriaceae bacterium]
MTPGNFARTAFLLAALVAGGVAARAQSIQRNIYDANANARADIHYALLAAQRDHKRVILDFGGNWCGDCIVLNYYLHQPPNATLLARNFILVDIDIGQYDHNLDIAHQYDIPLKLGVPALAVLSPGGQLLYSQRHAEFEKMAHTDPSAVTAFLNRWKPAS